MKKNNIKRKGNKVVPKNVSKNAPKKVSKERLNKIVFWILISAFVFWSIASILGIIAFFRTNKRSGNNDTIVASAALPADPTLSVMDEEYWDILPLFESSPDLFVGNVVDYTLVSTLTSTFQSVNGYFDPTLSGADFGMVFNIDIPAGYVGELILSFDTMVGADYPYGHSSYYIGFGLPANNTNYTVQGRSSSAADYVVANSYTMSYNVKYFNSYFTNGNYRILLDYSNVSTDSVFTLYRPYVYVPYNGTWAPNSFPSYYTNPVRLNMRYLALVSYGDGKQDGDDIGYDRGYELGYEAGYDEGNDQGFAEGHELGYYQGYEAGKPVGYEEGKAAGIDEGIGIGYIQGEQAGKQIGYASGFDEGYDYGYDVGKDFGYGEGVSAGSNPRYTFTGLITSVIDVPIKAFTSLFNFELLGVNLANFFFALLSVMAVLAVVKLLI